MEQINSLMILISLPVLVLFLFAIRLLWLVSRRMRERSRVEHNPRDLLLETLQEKTLEERQARETSKQTILAYESLDALHRTVMTHMPVGLMVLNNKKQVQFANPRSMELLQVEAVTGQNLSEVSKDLSLEFSKQQTTGFESEKKISLMIGGQPFFLNLGIQPLPDGRYLVTIQDQTRLERLEEQVRYKRDLALMGEMAGGVTHEIKNSLATIQGRVQLLAFGDVPKHSEKIMGEINRLLTFVSEFMKSSRQEEVNPEQFDIAVWLKELAQQWMDDPQGKHVAFEIEGKALITGDRPKLEMLLRNLILNGLQACESNPQTGDEIWVNVSLDTGEKDHIYIVVTDKGPGFPPGSRQKLFVPFVTSKEKGSGLGLFHSRKIMMAHGGDLQIEPDPPTRVKARFPRALPKDP